MNREPTYPDYDGGYTEEDEDDFDFDCHMRPDGQCGAAGSEMCDFECPMMAEIHREQYAARQKAEQRRRGGKRQGRLPLKD